MDNNVKNESMDERFIRTEIILKQGRIRSLQKEATKAYDETEFLNNLRATRPEKITKRYASEEEFLSYINSEIDKNQQLAIECGNSIKAIQTELLELKSLDQNGKQAVLDKFISENVVNGENVARVMDDYFKRARLDIAIALSDSTAEAIQLQERISPFEVMVKADIDRIAQLSDEDIQNITNKLKEDKEVQKLINKRNNLEKVSDKIDKGLGVVETIGSAGIGATIIAGIPALVASMFGIQHQAVDTGLIVGGIGGITAIAAGIVPIVKNAIEKGIERKEQSIKSKVVNKIGETIQEF